MKNKKIYKIFSFILILVTTLNVSFGTMENGHFVQFGQWVEASATNKFNFECREKIYKETEGGYINALFTGNGDISIIDHYVKGHVTFKCSLPGAYKYNYIDNIHVYVYRNGEGIGGNQAIDRLRINSDGTCGFSFAYELDQGEY